MLQDKTQLLTWLPKWYFKSFIPSDLFNLDECTFTLSWHLVHWRDFIVCLANLSHYHNLYLYPPIFIVLCKIYVRFGELMTHGGI